MVRTTCFLEKKCKFAILIKMNLKFYKMRKLLFTIVATVLMASSLVAQNVARECVLVEAFTGVRCGYCPAAAGGIAEMLKQGLSVAPLAFHCNYYSEEYATPETEARGRSFYGVAGYPTVIVDGVSIPAVAGPASYYLSSYNNLKIDYDKRINVESPFTIDLTFDYHSEAQCQAKAVVSKVGECAGDDVRVFMALTESHIPQEWGGWSELNAVVRDIITVPAGEVLEGDSQEVTAVFDLTPWNKENCEIVAWVQNVSAKSKEVYQAVKISIVPEKAEYDLSIIAIDGPKAGLCSGKVAPRFVFKNYGSQTLTSAVFKVTDENKNEIGSYKWEGELASGKQTDFLLPEFNFNGEVLNVEAVDLNGNFEDKYAYDNKFRLKIQDPISVLADGILKFMVKSSEPENVSVDIVNMTNGDVLKTLTLSSSSVVQMEYKLPEAGCYRVVIKNSKGNGIGDSNSYWGILNSKKKEMIVAKKGDRPFAYEYVIEMAYGIMGVEDVTSEIVSVYPNPAKSVVNVYAENLNKVTVFNTMGQVIYTEIADTDNLMIDVTSWANGLYYINLETRNGVKSSQKVTVNK